MIACHRTGQARFPRYSRGNGTFDQPSAGTWRFFNDIAMERLPTLEKLRKFLISRSKRPSPHKLLKTSDFVNKQMAGEAVLEGLQKLGSS